MFEKNYPQEIDIVQGGVDKIFKVMTEIVKEILNKKKS